MSQAEDGSQRFDWVRNVFAAADAADRSPTLQGKRAAWRSEGGCHCPWIAEETVQTAC